MFGLKELERAFLQYHSPSKVPSESMQLNMASEQFEIGYITSHKFLQRPLSTLV